MKNAAIALTILGFASLTEGYQVRSLLQNQLTQVQEDGATVSVNADAEGEAKADDTSAEAAEAKEDATEEAADAKSEAEDEKAEAAEAAEE